jgi:hypothetical protein
MNPQIDFNQKWGGTPNPFTVSQMTFFRSLISIVCRKNKVSEGISKKGAKNENNCAIYAAYFKRGSDKPG